MPELRLRAVDQRRLWFGRSSFSLESWLSPLHRFFDIFRRQTAVGAVFSYRRLPSLPYRGFPNPQTVRQPGAPDPRTSPPLGKSAIQPVEKPAVCPHKMPMRCRPHKACQIRPTLRQTSAQRFLLKQPPSGGHCIPPVSSRPGKPANGRKLRKKIIPGAAALQMQCRTRQKNEKTRINTQRTDFKK